MLTKLHTHDLEYKCVCVHSVCPTLCGSIDCSPPGSSVHGIFRARILEPGAISFSRGASWCRDWTCISCVSCIGRWVLYHCTIWEALWPWAVNLKLGNLPPAPLPSCLALHLCNSLRPSDAPFPRFQLSLLLPLTDCRSRKVGSLQAELRCSRWPAWPPTEGEWGGDTPSFRSKREWCSELRSLVQTTEQV